uniref:Uncharacterized protein n=1 Tax=Siphovirus contig89 TaxID=1518022 RepID=A0A075EHE9_9CAUD|nr:hypothetical protein [Siphovirus contig89]AIE38424.1 hypothetical protein [Siphovirus contig89]AIE38467.1 hypothetical protein [Siphovirus contig89]AIE38510.1 hypothetical protein [Siphovirus contig89]AIE38553.1 hypothetical protein [Siphovirus contig89]
MSSMMLSLNVSVGAKSAVLGDSTLPLSFHSVDHVDIVLDWHVLLAVFLDDGLVFRSVLLITLGRKVRVLVTQIQVIQGAVPDVAVFVAEIMRVDLLSHERLPDGESNREGSALPVDTDREHEVGPARRHHGLDPVKGFHVDQFATLTDGKARPAIQRRELLVQVLQI